GGPIRCVLAPSWHAAAEEHRPEIAESVRLRALRERETSAAFTVTHLAQSSCRCGPGTVFVSWYRRQSRYEPGRGLGNAHHELEGKALAKPRCGSDARGCSPGAAAARRTIRCPGWASTSRPVGTAPPRRPGRRSRQ